MLIYFDESYDQERQYLLLGTLFNPHPKFLHQKLLEMKKKYNYLDQNGKALEIKYNNCINKKREIMNCEAIDIFMRSTRDDGIPFEEKMAELTQKLSEQMKEEKRLDEEIKKQLKNVGFNLN